MNEPAALSAAAPIVECEQHHPALWVPDIPAAVDFYTSKLGFKPGFTWGEPPEMAGMNLGDVSIHLALGEPTPNPKGCAVYFVIGNADELYDFHRANGIAIVNPIGDRPYELRDYTVRDPYGYELGFGHRIYHTGCPVKVERVEVPLRLTQPEELKTDKPLKWSPGAGADVWELFCACIAGDLEAVKRLLHKDPSLARCHYNYRKPLYFAVRENRTEVTAFLLEHDPDPTGLAVNDSLLDIARDRGYAEMERLLETKLAERHGASRHGEPVAAAIRERNLAKVRALLDASPELLHAGDGRSSQPIHWAVMTRQLHIIDELLQRGADINARRGDGARPIHLTNGDYHYRGWRDVPEDWPTTPEDVFGHLVNHGANVDLGMACATGNLARVRELLDQDPSLVNRLSDYNAGYIGGGAPIKNSAAHGHLEVVKLLLERGADPNLPEEGIAPRGHALYSAASNGHFEVAKLLLEHGAYPNAEVESSADTLSRAISNGDQKMIELLCSHGAARAVHLLAYYNDLQTVAAVFAANPVLADDPDALANAASEGHEAFVRLMLRYRPDLPRRVTFPGWAVGAKTRELNELLFQHGMNPNAPDWLGITPLHHFARKGDVEKVAMFVDHGANLHARDEDICSTPLAWAAKFNQKSMVEFLLERGAKPNLPDDPPWATPLAWAIRRGHADIAELLKRHGAK